MGRSFRLVSPVYLLAGAISWPFVKVGFRLRAHGREHLPQGGFVLAANHTSNFDPWPLVLPPLPRRQLRFMAKVELFNPVLAPILRAGGVFPVRGVAVKRPLLVIDGDSLAHRAYHALPTTIRRADRRPSNAIVGFTNFLLRLWDSEQPRAVVVGWDTLEVPTYRHEAFDTYQSGREFDDELLEQLGLLPQLVEAFGFAYAKAPGYEADDFLAAAVAAEEKRRGTAVVATSDRDSFQLASERTTIIQPVRGVSELARIGPAEVRERYGVEPAQVVDFIALRGDPS